MDAQALDFLCRQHPFDRLTPAEVETVARTAGTLAVPGGTVVLRQGGKVSGFLHVVGRGGAHLVRDGRVVQEIEEGECFGYPSILSGDPPSADVVTAGETGLHRIPADVFRQLLGNADFAGFFLASLSQRLRTASRRDAAALGGAMTTAVGTLARGAPLTVDPGATVADAARAMRDGRTDVVLVSGELPGILTDHDFQVKVLAEGRGPDTPVREVMTSPVRTLPADTPVHGALLYLLEHRIHHLPVTGDEGISGVVSATDLLRHQTRSPLSLLHRLDGLEPDAALGWYAGEVAGMVEDLFAGGLKVAQLGKVIAQVNDTLVHRLVALAQAELGPPPCPFAWLVFGSEGRMEQALLTDQDNALVYAQAGEANAAYFAGLARHVVDNLVAAGFPPCPGGYMATHWCRPLDEMREIFGRWIGGAGAEALVEAAIFFDFRAVCGDLDLEPLHALVAGAADNQLFLARLARVARGFRPPLGLFRRIRADEGQVDLKTGGLAPVVAMARVYGLLVRTRLRPTRERLEAAIAGGALSAELGETLVETYRFLLQLRLEQQLAALREGEAPGNRIVLDRLSPVEQRHLKDAFQAIRELQDAATQRFHIDSLA
ncbi:MAG: DUF294 nucleotidyltransferase-like domain-containing protein [Candidatus Krumholzibacteriia bacterium]